MSNVYIVVESHDRLMVKSNKSWIHLKPLQISFVFFYIRASTIIRQLQNWKDWVEMHSTEEIKKNIKGEPRVFRYLETRWLESCSCEKSLPSCHIHYFKFDIRAVIVQFKVSALHGHFLPSETIMRKSQEPRQWHEMRADDLQLEENTLWGQTEAEITASSSNYTFSLVVLYREAHRRLASYRLKAITCLSQEEHITEATQTHKRSL